MADPEKDSPSSSNKKLLRQQFRRMRRALVGADRTLAEAAIHTALAELVTPQDTVCAYLAYDGEVDLRPWLQATAATVGLPRIDAESMQFHTWQPDDTLTDNRFGIAEPLPTAPQIEPSTVDIVLAPLVAFDVHGTRLGLGGGYYDRFLSQLRPSARVIGMAFACQQAQTALPQDTWDRSLSAIVTELGTINF